MSPTMLPEKGMRRCFLEQCKSIGSTVLLLAASTLSIWSCSYFGAASRFIDERQYRFKSLTYSHFVQCISKDEFEQAEQAFVQSSKGKEFCDPAVLSAAETFADICEYNGDFKKAADLYEKSLAERQRTDTKDPVRIGQSQAYLANCYTHVQGHGPQIEGLLDGAESQLKNHPDQIALLMFVYACEASIKMDRREYVQCQQVLKKAIERASSDQHGMKYLPGLYEELCLSFEKQGKFAEAQIAAQEWLRQLSYFTGEKSVPAAFVLGRLATNYRLSGQSAQARKCCEQILVIVSGLSFADWQNATYMYPGDTVLGESVVPDRMAQIIQPCAVSLNQVQTEQLAKQLFDYTNSLDSNYQTYVEIKTEQTNPARQPLFCALASAMVDHECPQYALASAQLQAEQTPPEQQDARIKLQNGLFHIAAALRNEHYYRAALEANRIFLRFALKTDDENRITSILQDVADVCTTSSQLREELTLLQDLKASMKNKPAVAHSELVAFLISSGECRDYCFLGDPKNAHLCYLAATRSAGSKNWHFRGTAATLAGFLAAAKLHADEEDCLKRALTLSANTLDRFQTTLLLYREALGRADKKSAASFKEELETLYQKWLKELDGQQSLPVGYYGLFLDETSSERAEPYLSKSVAHWNKDDDSLTQEMLPVLRCWAQHLITKGKRKQAIELYEIVCKSPWTSPSVNRDTPAAILDEYAAVLKADGDSHKAEEAAIQAKDIRKVGVSKD